MWVRVTERASDCLFFFPKLSHLRCCFSPVVSLHSLQYTSLLYSPSVFLCLSPFPVLCFKAEACVTHSTWHMKPLSCLEPGERKTGGERERDVGGGWVE